MISTAARDHALGLIEPPRDWGLWAGRLIAVVGAALVLAGIVYFFAFNWNRIPPLTKLAAIAGLFALACGTIGFVGFGRLVSDVAASAAVMFVGVFLAVYGQIYQTGADAWELFFGWAALCLPLVILAGSAAAWAIWLAVANIAVSTWWGQTQPADHSHNAGQYLSLIVLDGSFLVAREVLAARGIAWVSARWTRFFAAIPILFVMTLLALALIDRPRDFAMTEKVALVAVPVIYAVFLVVYRRLVPDILVLSATVVSLAVVADVFIYHLMSGGGRSADIGTFFLMGFVTLGIFAGGIAWLRAEARRMGG